MADALEMLCDYCVTPIIEKVRHRVEDHGLVWDVDEFGGANAGLILAEVELTAADQAIKTPDWVGEEVTDDPRYFNVNLASRPYSMWARD